MGLTPEEIKKLNLSPEDIERMKNHERLGWKFVIIALIFLICVLAWVGYEEIKDSMWEAEARKKIAEEVKSKPPKTTTHTTADLPETNPNEWKPGITVVATPVQLGDDLIIRTRVNNRNSYAIDEKIYLYVVDGTDCKYFVDVLYADLQSGEVGNATSSIKTSKLGPPPYKIMAE